MRARGFITSSVFLLISIAAVMLAFASLSSDAVVHRSALTGQYMKLDAARKVGLDAGEAWILKNAGMGYAPRVGFHGAMGTPEERIAATSVYGSSVERIGFTDGVGIDVSVADLDYPADLFGERGSRIPRLPSPAGLDETGRYYLIRSTATDAISQSLSAEELFLISIDNFGAITGARKIFYR